MPDVSERADARNPAASPSEIQLFTFRGDALDVVRLADGDVGVSVRRLSEALGLDPDAQLRRLDRGASEGVRWATTVTMAVVAADGKIREVRCLPRRSIPMWAATVDASRVDDAVRAKLVAYQDEAAEVLAAAFLPPAPAAGHPSAVRGELPDLLARALADGDVPAARAVHRAIGALLGPGPKTPRAPRIEPERPDLSVYRARILDRLGKGSVAGGIDGLCEKATGHRPYLRAAVKELLAEGLIVRREGRIHLAGAAHEPDLAPYRARILEVLRDGPIVGGSANSIAQRVAGRRERTVAAIRELLVEGKIERCEVNGRAAIRLARLARVDRPRKPRQDCALDQRRERAHPAGHAPRLLGPRRRSRRVRARRRVRRSGEHEHAAGPHVYVLGHQRVPGLQPRPGRGVREPGRPARRHGLRRRHLPGRRMRGALTCRSSSSSAWPAPTACSCPPCGRCGSRRASR